MFAWTDLVLSYTTSEEPKRAEATICLPPDLPLFDGHFPNNPILPAVGQMLLCRRLIERHLGDALHIQEIRHARMTEPLLPATLYQIKWTLTPLISSEQSAWRASIQIHHDLKKCTRMTVLLACATLS